MTLIGGAIVIALASQHPSYAATPQQAALAAVYVARPAVVLRTNVAGRYATVLIRGAMLEGASITYRNRCGALSGATTRLARCERVLHVKVPAT